MKANTKEWVQYGSAIGMLASGVALTFLCFFLNSYDIKDNVLIYVGQCLIYAGSIFGVSIYFKNKSKEIIDELRKSLQNDKEGEE